MILGLTGGIGSGKSTVSEYICEKYGFELVDADIVSREIVEPDSPLLKEIADTFGEEYILPDGNLDRKALGRDVFAMSDGKKKLDSIMMAEILDIIDERIANAKDNLLVDAALLFEEGIYLKVDKSILVDADLDTRIMRVCDRDKSCEIDVMNRIKSQMPSDEKRKLADIVIDNDGTVEELYEKVDNIMADMV